MSKKQPLKVVFIVAHDAYLKGAKNILTLLPQQKPLDVHWYTTSQHLLKYDLEWLDLGMVSPFSISTQADIIFAGLGGRDLNRLINAVKVMGRAASSNPLIVGFFPGILHLRMFESLATRLRCDCVLLNCERDYQLYQSLARVTTGRSNGLLLGAPWIGEPPSSSRFCDIDLLFVEQSIVPQSFSDRVKLVKNLIKLAGEHPNWLIVVALRAVKGQASSHHPEYCLMDILQQIGTEINNLKFVHDDIDQLLIHAKRVATISSSVAFTSLAWGKPTVFINDLGVHKSWGNDLFKRSGYMASLHSENEFKQKTTLWCEKFIQKPNPKRLAEIYQLQPYVYAPKISGAHIGNLRLLWLFIVFCVRTLSFDIAGFRFFLSAVRNINRRASRFSNKQKLGSGLDF